MRPTTSSSPRKRPTFSWTIGSKNASHNDSQGCLPVELYRPIVEALAWGSRNSTTSGRDMLNLSLTCRAFQIEAERVLYRDIEIIYGTKQSFLLSETLGARTAKYVSRLTIVNYGITIPRSRFSFMKRREPLSVTIPFVLMSGMRYLVVTRRPSRQTSEALRINGEVPEDHLLSLLSEQVPENTILSFRCTLPVSDATINFLERQSSINTLGLGVTDTPGVTNWETFRSPTFLPNLEAVRAVKIDNNLEALMLSHRVSGLVFESWVPSPPQWGGYACHLTFLDLSAIPLSNNREVTTFLQKAINVRFLLISSYNLQLQETFALLSPLVHLWMLSVTIIPSSAKSGYFAALCRKYGTQVPSLQCVGINGTPRMSLHKTADATWEPRIRVGDDWVQQPDLGDQGFAADLDV
ncbi:hypothetical protein SISSUDRAFT_308995 [Sistotremastrum suecicum HHB10207 ss-3]|uniref:Uncharacterized protein n=1 Tax=Sistotremastrum suecicum HHB10207 ss-3 TaxID=1314776 RepID=A0A165ZDI6_9AGAM|nr:hypothetical protein SISSUDRAFT_308995 [Sistotremastrum suecicum HHB10207 ss-3]